MPDLPNSKPADKTEVFRALCWSRATRWRAGDWDWIGDAVDPLQWWAVREGLVDEIGQDVVQAMMAQSFGGNHG